MNKDVFIIGAIALAAYLYMRSNNDTESENSPDAIDYANALIDYGKNAVDNTDNSTAQLNINAFLNAIRVGEGTAKTDGYYILFGGGRFVDDGDHPALQGWQGVKLSPAIAAAAGFKNGAVSTAAGAYQINRPTWLRLQNKMNLPDFSPASQDAAALQLISEKGALSDVKAGRVQSAVDKVKKIWASLPNAGYGQREVTMTAFINDYKKYGGLLA
jgi:muramidase (phage lysozyme)